MPKAAWRLLLALLVALPARAPAADVVVQASRNGDVLEVHASAEFEGSVARARQVLTDYDHLAEFIPDETADERR